MTASAHIWSKLIVCLVWTIADAILVILSVFGLFVNMDILRVLPEALSLLFSTFPDAFGISAGLGIPLYLLLFLVDSVSGILVIYMCIAVGHSFNTHKILSSVGIYVGIMILSSILGAIFSALTGMVTYSSMSLAVTVDSSISGPVTFWTSWIFSMVVSLATGIICYLLTNYFMTKKLNLE